MSYSIHTLKIRSKQGTFVQAAAAFPDDSNQYDCIPPRLEAALMAFQREGVAFALRRGARCLIADEMGLGAQSHHALFLGVLF